MVGVFPDDWAEVALVTLQKKGGTAYQYAAISETVDIGEPDYPGESIKTLVGGRIWKQTGQEDGEVTLEIYPISANPGSNTGLFQEFAGGTWDTSEPVATDTTFVASIFGAEKQRDRYIIAIMWTDDTAVTSAMAATSTTDKVALRFYAKECRFISHKTDFTDGMLKTTVTLKFPAMNKAGDTRSFAWESTNATQVATNLPALTYT